VTPFLKAVLASLTEKGKKREGERERGGEENEEKKKRKEARVEGRRNNFHLMDS
jgi:hypothetical protein